MPDYFRSIGISLKAGRTLNESDTATAEKAVVVNEAFVKDYLADVANPLGQRVYIGKMFGFEQPWRIVGVVSDARQFNLRSAPPASVFVSVLQLANAEGKFVSLRRAGLTLPKHCQDTEPKGHNCAVFPWPLQCARPDGNHSVNRSQVCLPIDAAGKAAILQSLGVLSIKYKGEP